MYAPFYDGEEPPKPPHPTRRKGANGEMWGRSSKEARLLAKFCRLFSRMEEDNLGVVLFMARKMARRRAV
jgi:hypothetical protein